MQKINMIIRFCCVFVFAMISFIAHTQVVVDSKTDASNECDGSLNLSVNGDACTGEYVTACKITLKDSDGAEIDTYDVTNGKVNITGLCAGEYKVELYNEIFACDFEGPEVEIRGCGTDGDIQSLDGTIEPTCPGESDGSITLTVNGGTPPYRFFWSDDEGEGTSPFTIAGLGMGSYTVKVIDDCGREVEETFEVEEEEIPFTEADADVVHDCDGEGNGSISFGFRSGINQYDLLWSNGATTSGINDLSAGMYDLTITDPDTDCSKVLNFTVNGGETNFDVALNSLTNANDPESTDGSISVNANGEGSFTYEWSNGQTSSTASNLAAGSYMVTVTNADGCSIVKTYEVGSCNIYQNTGAGVEVVPNPEFEDFEIKIIGGPNYGSSTPNRPCIPLIVFVKEGGSDTFIEADESYALQWTTNFGENFSGNNLCLDGTDTEKVFTVTVSNGCVSKMDEHKLVNCAETDHKALAKVYITEEYPACEGELGKLVIEFMFPTLAGATSSQYNVYMDEILVPTTLENNIVRAEVEVYAGDIHSFKITVGEFCQSDCSPCTIEFDHILEPIPPIIRPIESNDGRCLAEEICGGVSTIIEQPTYTIPNTGTFEKGGIFKSAKCITPIYCNGVQVDELDMGMTRLYLPEFQALMRDLGKSEEWIMATTGGSDNPCQTWRVCLADVDNSWKPIGQARLGDQPLGFFLDRETCKFWCYQSKTGGYLGVVLGPLLGSNPSDHVVYVPGCGNDDRYNLSDFININISPGGNDFDPDECGDEVNASIYQLYMFMLQGGFEAANVKERFENSELKELLDWYDANRGVVNPSCLKIDYCVNNFSTDIEQAKSEISSEACSKIFSDNNCAGYPYCDEFYNPNNPSEDDPLAECGIYKLNLVDSWRGDINVQVKLDKYLRQIGIDPNTYSVFGPPGSTFIGFKTDFDINSLTPSEKNELLKLYMDDIKKHGPGSTGAPYIFKSTEIACADGDKLSPLEISLNIRSRVVVVIPLNPECDPEDFVNIFPVRYKDRTLPAGSFLERNDSTFFYNTMEGMNIPTQESLDESNNIEHAYLDLVDSVYITAAVEQDGRAYTIKFDNNQNLWSSSITSSTGLTVEQFHQSLDNVFIGGTFSGELQLDETPLANSNVKSLFVSKLDFQGNPNSTITIENISNSQQPAFSEDRNGNIIIAAAYEGNEIVINGIPEPMGSRGGVFTAKISADDEVEVLENIKSSANGILEVMDVAYSEDESQHTTLVYTNTPSVDLNGTNISAGDASENLLMLRTNGSGFFEQSHSLDATNIKRDKFDAAYGTNNQLLTGITFENTLSLPSDDGSESGITDINSAGGEDIAILGFDRNGQLNLQETYGSASNENVSQILFDDDILSFSGEFASNGDSTSIGNLIFSGGECDESKVYVSYIYIDPPFSDPGECNDQALTAIENDQFYQVNNEEIIEGLGEEAPSYEHYAPSDGDRRIGDAVTDRNKDVLTTGTVNHSETQSSLEIGKKTPDGDFAWTKSYQSTSEETSGNGIAIDNADNVVVAGQFANDLKISDSEMLQTNGGTDAVINKLNEEGEEIWTKQVGSAGNDAALSVGAGSNESVFATGHITGSTVFDELSTNNPEGKQSLFLAKYRSDGVVEWVKTGSNDANADFENSMLVTDSEGNVIVAGDYTGTFRLEGSSTPLTADGSLGKASFIAKYSPDGQVLWSESVGKGAEMHLTSIVIDDQDNVTVAGEFSGLNEFAEGEDLISNGGKDIFFAKFDKAGKMFWLKQQGEENDEVIHDLTTDGEGRFAYVATATGSTILEGENFDAEEGTENCITVDFNCDAEVEHEITDATCGEENGVINLTITGSSENYFFEWSHEDQMTEDLGGLGAGEYIVTITDGANCALTRDFEVKAIPPFAATATPHAATCEQSNGYIILDITGGNPPFIYAWSTGETTKNISGLAPDTYTVTITDQECSKTLSVTIEDTPKPTLQPTIVNATCGRSDGSIILNVIGTTRPYSYRWSNGAATKDLVDVPAGTYSVTVTDADNCSVELENIGIGDENFEVDYTAFSGTCDPVFGNGNGSLSATVVGGTSSYSMYATAEDGSVSQQISSDNSMLLPLPPGNYSIQITDSGFGSRFIGCSVYFDVHIPSSNGGGPRIDSVNTTPTSCNLNNGSASVSTVDGRPPYTYEWSNGVNSSSTNNLSKGVYQVTVTDSDGCTDVATATVEENTTLVVSTNATNASCNTCADGSASASASNNPLPYTRPYEYLWSTGATGEDIDGLLPGTYEVTVTDRDGCEQVGVVTIGYDVLCELSINSSVSGASCGNCADGSINLNVEGGLAPYTYEWSTGAMSSDINQLLPGTYSVTVTDANDCQQTTIIEVSSPEDCAVEATFAVQPTSCVTCEDGRITTFVTAGTSTPPNSFEWSNGAITSGQSNLASGTYDLTITDAAGCEAIYTVVVPQSDCDIQIEITAEEPKCSNSRDGVLRAAVSGGTEPYTYRWRQVFQIGYLHEEGVLSYADTITDIRPNRSYEVEVTDANGCKAKKSGYVSNPSAMHSNVVKDIYFLPWSGVLRYDARVEVVGGEPPYTYSWREDFPIDENTHGEPEQEALHANVWYQVIVGDASGCYKTHKLFEYQVPPPPPGVVDLCDYSVVVSSDINPCSDQVNGTLTVVVDGGNFSDDDQSPYNILWSTGETSSTININAAGTYSVEVTSFGGCKTTESIIIGEVQQLRVDAVADKTLCPTCADGTANAIVSGGTAPFSYAWSNGGTEASIAGLAAGTYSVTVTDENGCTGSASTVVNNAPCNIGVQLSPIPPSCFGYADGGVVANVSGNGSSYEFEWSNGEQTSGLTGVAAGDYTVTVTNNFKCQAITSVTVVNPEPIIIEFTTQHISANDAADGSITANASGGTGGYSYAWSTGDDEATISDLEADNYTVTVTDEKGCTKISTAVVNGVNCDDFQLTYKANPPKCHGAADGSIIAEAIGGHPPYQYSWSNGETGSSINGLVAEAYSVEVVDSLNCRASVEIGLSQPTPLKLTMYSTDVTIIGGTDGSASVSVTGGTQGIPPYTYNWSNGVTANFINMLSEGDYTVEVIDGNGCTASNSVSVNEPNCNDNPISVGISVKDVSCKGLSDGSISANVSGGAGFYFYRWSNASSGYDLSSIVGLPARTYSLTVTDDRGCKKSVGGITVSEPNSLRVSFELENPSCGQSDGSITAIASGGTPNYSYSWSNGQSGASIGDLGIDTYTVTVVDANKCETIASVYLRGKNKNDICNLDLDSAGGDKGYTGSFGPYGEDVTINVVFDSYSIPDELIFSSTKQDGSTGSVNFSSGCIGDALTFAGADTTPCNLPDGNYSTSFILLACEELTISVNPTCGCGYESGTAWVLEVSCNDQLLNRNVERRSIANSELIIEEAIDLMSSPTIQIYPNPFNDLLHIDIDTPQSHELEVVIVDLMGRVIYRQLVDTQIGLNKLTIDMATTNATNGLYQVLIRGKDTAPQNFKVVRMRQ